MRRKFLSLKILFLVTLLLSGCFEREIETRARPERGRSRVTVADEMSDEVKVRRQKDKEWFIRSMKLRREEKAKKQMERDAYAFEKQLERDYKSGKLRRSERGRQRSL